MPWPVRMRSVCSREAPRSNVLLEDRVAAEHAGVQELEDRPELTQVVFDRRAAYGQLEPAAQEPRGLCRLALGVLDRLGFVQDHVVKLEVGQLGNVRAHGAVRGDDQVVVGEKPHAAHAGPARCSRVCEDAG